MRVRISLPKIFFFIVALCATVMIFTSSFFNVLYDEEYLQGEFTQLGDQVKVTEPEVKAKAIITYFSNEEDLMRQSEVIFTDKQMTTDELYHLRDVKTIMQGTKRVYFASFIIFFLLLIGFISSIFSKHKDREIRKERLALLFIKLQTYVLAITGIVLAVFGACSIFSFDRFFTRFHQLFFPGGNWTFPSDSLLISLFPKQFFFDFVQAFLSVVFKFVVMFLMLFAIIYGLFILKVPKDERAEKNREIFGRFLAPFGHKKKKRSQIREVDLKE